MLNGFSVWLYTLCLMHHASWFSFVAYHVHVAQYTIEGKTQNHKMTHLWEKLYVFMIKIAFEFYHMDQCLVESVSFLFSFISSKNSSLSIASGTRRTNICTHFSFIDQTNTVNSIADFLCHILFFFYWHIAFNTYWSERIVQRVSAKRRVKRIIRFWY